MKGIFKGVVFSLLLTAALAAVAAILNMLADISDTILKTGLWSMVGLSVFLGAMLVSRGSEAHATTRGIICTVLTILGLLITSTAINGHMPSGGFYTLALIASICGVLGAFLGSRQA